MVKENHSAVRSSISFWEIMMYILIPTADLAKRSANMRCTAGNYRYASCSIYRRIDNRIPRSEIVLTNRDINKWAVSFQNTILRIASWWTWH
jgi:hypothetical protein